MQVKPKVVKNSGDPDNQLDDPSKMPTTVTTPGSCKSHMGWHKNGDEWHPIIASMGEQKCIKCRCKVSKKLTAYLIYLLLLCNVSDLVSCQSNSKKIHSIEEEKATYSNELIKINMLLLVQNTQYPNIYPLSIRL